MRAAPAWQGGPGQTMTYADSGTDFYLFTYSCGSCSQDPSSEERFHVELHFSPGVKGCEEDRNVPTGFGFRPASAEVSTLPGRRLPCPLEMWPAWGPQAPCSSTRLCSCPVSSSKFSSDPSLMPTSC